MNIFRTLNRVPPSGEWHLSGKRLVGRVHVTRRFAAGWAAQSDSNRGKRSWVSSALGAHGWRCCLQLDRRGDLAVRWRRPR